MPAKKRPKVKSTRPTTVVMKRKGKTQCFERRFYTDEDRRKAILLCKTMSLPDVSRKLDIPVATLECWSKGWRHPKALAYANETAGTLAEMCEEVVWLIASGVEDKVAEAGLGESVGAMSRLISAAQLLRGKPTAIQTNQTTTVNLNVDVMKLAERMNYDERILFLRLAEQAAARDAGGVGSGDPSPEQSGCPPQVLPVHP